MSRPKKKTVKKQKTMLPNVPAELAEKANIGFSDMGSEAAKDGIAAKGGHAMKGKQPVGQKLRKFSLETRLKSSNEFTDKVVKTFKDYIKSVVVWGSITRGDFTGKSDVDLYVIFDDTKMPLKKFDELREKIDKDLYKMASDTDPRLHVQPVLALTEFWDGIRTCHPLFYNIVREGYALHDTGFFIPMRKLLEWGKFPATMEAAEIRMEGVPKRISRVQSVKLYMIAEDLYYAITDAAQSVLMYVGVGPPAPKVLAKEVRKHLVETKLLEEEWAKLIEDVMSFRKAVEHKEIKEITGQELDNWIARTDKYVKRMGGLLDNLEIERKAYDIKKNYEVMIKASVAALKAINKLPPEPEKLPAAFKKYLIEPGLVAPWYSEVFGKVIEMRKMLEDKKMTDIPERDVYMSKEYVRRFIMDVRRVVESKRPEQKQMEIPSEPIDKMSEAGAMINTAREIGMQQEAVAGMKLPSSADSKVRKIAEKIEKGKKEAHKKRGE
ncbi:MAG: nucleotidyltransferase domain-containing protein [Candidatus Aenigmatarchaeota archaeon]